MNKPKRLIIMAAGTGGHIFPGLAIARTMREKGWQVTWLGTRHGMETTLVPAQGIELDSIDFAGMRGKGLMHMVTGGIKLLAGMASCLNIICRRKPDLVVGMGGYVTVPGGFACRIMGVPLVLINADAGLLLSNKTLLPAAKRILFGFPADPAVMTEKGVLTGNPVRHEIAVLPEPKNRYEQRNGPLNVLVIGGSLGARALNECMPYALAQLSPEHRPRVIHQTGKEHSASVRQAYMAAQVEAEVVEFIDDMAFRYASTDLVVCRAGAITVSELTAAGLASILVPFIASSTSHQRDNATYMAAHKAAVHLPQSELTPEHLASLLRDMTRERCLAMAEVAYALGRRHANEAIANELERVANEKN
ncbi:undecaprenyldiphospho-muramoylpentapeptide beta-N-acetylglucosaminyltransferase [Oxalobacter vibrioformis]|uniref:UDP-N-acetylglucosamine--N-acetylmuramyl-(pentapeptide) pyrophosphoryl-undecaprenol N-acetylglucosamine transferase n=1 Tax=Oxalobacter vibrioformis TaxID=933080 RepID=A0A9E9M0V6_9BURK|nr:undecaprenyldiphospho-muramoylpentapeptide beta-N-acetylglucosaminyltransferase [Oxalobacter vibrioformis]WAW11124.1 undecaprenyldiphospho-muramoylpentapeptide beta-N-acetylglucosaminyltransferase [Oxalobacter vibrioformis]